MVERLIARSLSIDSIETQILRFFSGDIGLQTVLLEFQKGPRAFVICLDIINKHCKEFSSKSLPLILFCSQTLVECDHIYSLCRLVSDGQAQDLDKSDATKLDTEREETIEKLERVINLLEQLNKVNPQIFPSLRFLLCAWLRLKLFDNWSKGITFEIIQFVGTFQSNRQFQIELLAILAQEICNDKFILSIARRNELAKNCISQAPMVFKFLGVKDSSIGSVYSDWIQLHVKYLDSIVDEEQCELPSDVDLMVKLSLSTLISLNLIDKLFEQSPLPIHTITNLIVLCPLDNHTALQDDCDMINPLVNEILTLIICNLSKLYKIQSPLFKTTSPILLSLSYEQLPYLIEHQFSEDIDNILDGTIRILSNGDYPTRDVMVNFWINLKRNINTQNGWEKLADYLQKIVIVFYEMPLYETEKYDFAELCSFRESASMLLFEIADAIGHQFIFDIVECRLQVLVETINLKEQITVSFSEIESIFFILSAISSNAEMGKDTCIPTALALLNKLKYPTQGSLSLLLSISIGRLILWTAEYSGKKTDLFNCLFMLIIGTLLPSILRIKNNSASKDYLLGENILIDAMLALSRTSRKIVSEDTQEVKKYLICIYQIIKNVQFSIENRIKAVNAAGAIISYMPIAEMKTLFSDLIENLSNNIKSVSNPTDYIQLYLMAMQSVCPIPDCIESEVAILKIVEKHVSVMELLFTSSNEDIIERLSQVLVVVNRISRNHSEASPLFLWTLKLLSVSFRCSHPSHPYSALRSILINVNDCSVENWASISNSLLPSLAMLKDSIVSCCVGDKDRNLLQQQMSDLTMDFNTSQLLSAPDSVGLCVDCLNVALNRHEIANFLLDKSKFIIFLESLLIILPYIVHPKVLHACMILIKLVASIDMNEASGNDYSDSAVIGTSVYAKKIRLLNIISQRCNESSDEIHTITFKIVTAILSTVISGTCGVETWIDVAAETILALMCDGKTADEAKNAIDSFFEMISEPSINVTIKNDYCNKLKVPNTLFQALLQLEGWKLWKKC